MSPILYGNILSLLIACNGSEETKQDLTQEQEAEQSTSLELNPHLCDDPSNLATIQQNLNSDSEPSYGEINLAQAMRMMSAPTEGFTEASVADDIAEVSPKALVTEFSRRKSKRSNNSDAASIELAKS